MSQNGDYILYILGTGLTTTFFVIVFAFIADRQAKKPESPGWIAKTISFIASATRNVVTKLKTQAEERHQAPPPRTFREQVEQEVAQFVPPPFPDPLPEPPIAIRHRCLKGKRGRRVFVTDYADGVSTAKLLKKNRDRHPLGESPTSPDADAAFVEQANQL